MTRLVAFWIAHRAELASLFGQHVLLVAGSTLVAVALGVPLGVFSARRDRDRRRVDSCRSSHSSAPSTARASAAAGIAPARITVVSTIDRPR